MTENCEVIKVEKQDGWDAENVLVTAKSVWGVVVTFKVPNHRAKSYTIGRMVTVSLNLQR